MSFIIFGEYVQARLDELDISIEEAAERIGVDRKTVERYIKTGVQDIKASNLYKLARVLKWDPLQVYRAFHGEDPYASKEQQKRRATSKAFREFMDRLTEIDFEENL